MLIFRELKDNILPSSCLALGMFDGVHFGHQKVILDAVYKAKFRDAISTIVTFAEHPQQVITGRSPKLLTTLEQRIEIFKELGVQATLLLDFNQDIAKLSANDYFEQILVKTLNPRTITVGYNHHFGAHKEGDSNKLLELSRAHNIDIEIIEPVSIDNYIVSSSKIRSLIKNGDTAVAAKLLGKPYSVKGKVIHGEQRGRKMGFPTANLKLDTNNVAPKAGVYSGSVQYDNTIYKSVINIGKRPTFNDLIVDLLEVHIIDFSCDIYGEDIEVMFFNRIRDEQKFESVEQLVAQIKLDYEAARAADAFISPTF